MSAMEVVSLIPKSLSEAKELAAQLAVSRLLPAALQKFPADVMLIVMTGAELGLQPMQAIRGIHVIEGKPCMSADMMAALCLKARDLCEYVTCVETTSSRATYEAKRKGAQAVKLSWTIEQAKAAALLGKGNWAKYPDAMLRARCLSAICRLVFPDLVAGVYDPDELGADTQTLERAEKVAPSTPQNAEAMIEALKASVALTEPPEAKKRRLLLMEERPAYELGEEYDRLAAILEKADTWPQLRAASNLAADKGANLHEREKAALSAIYKLRHAEIVAEKERIVELAEMSSAEIPS